MSLICVDCGKPYPSGERGGHCTLCCESFRSDGAFEKHRTGKAGAKTCLPLADTDLEQDARGYWHLPASGDPFPWGKK